MIAYTSAAAEPWARERVREPSGLTTTVAGLRYSMSHAQSCVTVPSGFTFETKMLTGVLPVVLIFLANGPSKLNRAAANSSCCAVPFPSRSPGVMLVVGGTGDPKSNVNHR